MSASYIVSVCPGREPRDLHCLGNSWGTGGVTWDEVSKKYMGVSVWAKWGNHSGWEELEALIYKTEIPEDVRAVLAWTFPGWFVERKDFPRMAGLVLSYLEKLPPDGKVHNHWPSIPEILRKSKSYGLGIWCTTVECNPFRNGERDKHGERGRSDFTKYTNVFQALGL